jgi:hypothetical protein
MLATVAAVAALGVAGCGGDDDDEQSSGGTTPVTQPAPPAVTESSPTSTEPTTTEPQGYSGGYTEATKQKFTENCAGTGGGTKSQCRCLIDYIAKKVPFAEFATPTEKLRPALKAGDKKCGTKST